MQNKIIIGRFGKAHGIKGWIRVISFTDPNENILQYHPWHIKKNNQWQQLNPEDTKQHSKDIIIKLPHINDRDIAKTYTNLEIFTNHDQLPKLPKNEYYWSDLEGLTVIDKSGTKLGIVDHLIATGANDVLIVNTTYKQPLLIPYLDDVIIDINLNKKTITVDWEPDSL